MLQAAQQAPLNGLAAGDACSILQYVKPSSMRNTKSLWEGRDSAADVHSARACAPVPFDGLAIGDAKKAVYEGPAASGHKQEDALQRKEDAEGLGKPVEGELRVVPGGQVVHFIHVACSPLGFLPLPCVH